MLEKALTGSNRYWGWIAVLLAFMAAGALSYVQQFNYGLGLTGMSRDVSWGLYIAQFTFLVGVAASGVMVVLPYYLHDYKTFGKITILGEFLAVAAVSMCLLFIAPDPQFHPLLGHDRIKRLPLPEYLCGLDCPHSREKGSGAAQVDQDFHLYFHTMGSQYSYGNSLSVRRSSGTPFLAHRHLGPSLSGLGLCSRSGSSDSALPDHQAGDKV
jgi:hypothetical protein